MQKMAAVTKAEHDAVIAQMTSQMTDFQRIMNESPGIHRAELDALNARLTETNTAADAAIRRAETEMERFKAAANTTTWRWKGKHQHDMVETERHSARQVGEKRRMATLERRCRRLHRRPRLRHEGHCESSRCIQRANRRHLVSNPNLRGLVALPPAKSEDRRRR